MALSDKQRIAFFKLALRAYVVEQPDSSFDVWRKSEMIKAGLPDSLKRVSRVVGFDALMQHFACLAQDEPMVRHYESNERRLLVRIIEALKLDVAFLIANGCAFPSVGDSFDCSAFELPRLKSFVAVLGRHVDNACNIGGVGAQALPSAAAPYKLRGRRAAAYAARLNDSHAV
jgi:hypothetical protein